MCLSRWRDSNPQLPPWRGGALPIELHLHIVNKSCCHLHTISMKPPPTKELNLSPICLLVVRDGIEPPTLRSSVWCSTNWATAPSIRFHFVRIGVSCSMEPMRLLHFDETYKVHTTAFHVAGRGVGPLFTGWKPVVLTDRRTGHTNFYYHNRVLTVLTFTIQRLGCARLRGVDGCYD